MGNGSQPRGCIVLVVHTTTYNVEAFVAACCGAGAEAVIASDRCPVLDGVWQWPAQSVAVDFYDPAAAAATIAAHFEGQLLPPVLAVIPVGGEGAAVVAARAAERMGLRCNAPAAAEAAANKLRMRALCDAYAKDGAGGHALRVPVFRAFPFDADPARVAVVVEQAIGWPCVVKPLLLSGSRGVMRADDAGSLGRALARLLGLLSAPALLAMGGDDDMDGDGGHGDGRRSSRQILVEEFVPGPEVAVEGLLDDGQLRVLAFFDKPDPLDGPFFEETLYVTPSRHSLEVQSAVEQQVRAAARALGLVTGPVHAEVRLGPHGPVVIEVAARSIGGLCSRTLRFGTGLSLEDVLVRHALGDEVGGWGREQAASGVMMIPIPRAGVLKQVVGIAEARAHPGVEDLVVTARLGDTLVPLPEGASYLGFIFARGATPAEVETSLRAAHRALVFQIAPLLPLS